MGEHDIERPALPHATFSRSAAAYAYATYPLRVALDFLNACRSCMLPAPFPKISTAWTDSAHRAQPSHFSTVGLGGPPCTDFCMRKHLGFAWRCQRRRRFWHCA